MIKHLDREDTLLWFGWPSSVASANNHPMETWDSIDSFAHIVDGLQEGQRLIYASSCSVYDSIPGYQDENCNTFNLKNWYDFAKRTMDNIALLSGKHIYGLRLATVCGYSPSLRVDLMLNQMVHDAKGGEGGRAGEVIVSNPQLTRPVLGMSDLVRAVETIVNSKDDRRGIYNLASFAYSVENYGRMVAEKFNVPLRVIEGPPSYAWGVKTDKFSEAYDFEFHDTPESIIESLEKKPERVMVRL